MKFIYILILLFIVYQLIELVWAFIRRRRPVVYQGQSLEELEEHFDHFLTRAFSDAELYIEIENENKEEKFRIRKDCIPGTDQYEAFVIFENATEKNEGSKRLQNSLVRSGFKGRCQFDMPIMFTRGRYKEFLVCKCQNIGEVNFVVKKALEKFYSISEKSTFKVYAKGGIENGYVLRVSKTTFAEHMKPIRENKWAKPYLQHQVKPHKKYNCGPKGEHLG